MSLSWLIPRSTLGLTLAGFLLAALPLCVLTVTAVVRIDQMAVSSQVAALRASEISQRSRDLVDRLIAMERALGQYAVLGDKEFYANYLARRVELRGAADGLAGMHLGQAFTESTQGFLAAEQDLFGKHAGLSEEELAERWQSLSALARSLVEQSRALIETESLGAAEDALSFERLLLIQTLAVIPLSIILAIVFARLISQPIRQIDSAIRALAADSIHESVEIQGPKDLQEVGACLDALRTRIVALEKDKRNFVRRLSHELKTPLTTIRQGAELLADRAGTPPEQAAEIGDLLKESSLELQRLIEDLLEFGKTQRLVQDDLAVNSVDLRAVLQKLLSEHSLPLKSKRIQVSLTLDNVTVPGDLKRLRIALNNVLANAVKYTPVAGEIKVTLSKVADMAIIDIADSGPGIAQEDRGRVFEPFYQGQAVTGSPVKGTGLGLAIAKDYVESHNGHIEALDSYRGALFRVRLPLSTTA